jgi:hypothetical protein
MSDCDLASSNPGQPTGLGGSLASDLGEGILSKAGIEDGIRNLITIGELIH